MSFKSVVNSIILKGKKHSPEILIGAGVVGVIGSLVMTIKATRKVDPVIEKHKKAVDKIHEIVEDAEDKEEIKEVVRKETTKVYFKTGLEFAKLYAPAVGLCALSLTGIIASNHILNKRNASLVAAYSVLEKSYKEYRNRVVDRFGEETDYRLLHGVKTVTTEETIVDSKGKEKIKKTETEVADKDASGYLKYFTRKNPNWDENEDFILSFLNARQSMLNDTLKSKGWISLNDVYDALDFEKTKAGMVVGWVYDKKHPVGDNYIQFNVRKCTISNENGVFEDAYSIDFNVDGNIYNLV